MNINVARKLHERRFRANPVMTTGELITLIGSDGMQEAIDKRWITPDPDTGFMMINNHGGKLQELESACLCACGKTDCSCGPAQEEKPVFTIPMREMFAGPGLPHPSPTASTSTPATPAMMPRPAASPTGAPQAQPQPAHSGDTVKVTDEGKEFEGQVSGFEPDGRVRLRWKGVRPVHDRPYGAGEYMVVNPNEQHA